MKIWAGLFLLITAAATTLTLLQGFDYIGQLLGIVEREVETVNVDDGPNELDILKQRGYALTARGLFDAADDADPAAVTTIARFGFVYEDEEICQRTVDLDRPDAAIPLISEHYPVVLTATCPLQYYTQLGLIDYTTTELGEGTLMDFALQPWLRDPRWDSERLEPPAEELDKERRALLEALSAAGVRSPYYMAALEIAEHELRELGLNRTRAADRIVEACARGEVLSIIQNLTVGEKECVCTKASQYGCHQISCEPVDVDLCMAKRDLYLARYDRARNNIASWGPYLRELNPGDSR